MIKLAETCYMCSNPATSYEHAPPKCIFPELKDTNDGINRRKELIKVPSCDTHNSKKSKDDEYLLYILSMSVTSNKTGLNQFFSKVKRAINRRPTLVSALTEGATSTYVTNYNDSTKSDVVAIFPDGNRVNSALEKCARALYFNFTGRKYVGITNVVNGFLMRNNENSEQKLLAFSILENALANSKYLGLNQDSFRYKILVDANQSAILLLEFYETSKAIIDLRYQTTVTVQNS